MQKRQYLPHLLKDFSIVLVGILLAIVLVKTGALQQLLVVTQGAVWFASFLAGIFLSSSLTIAIAALALVQLSQHASPFAIAIIGSAGAVVGDVFVFLFIRDTLGGDVAGYMKERKYKKVIRLFHLNSIKWLALIVGVISIALPIPDEFGLTILSLSKVRTMWILPLSFITTFIEILTIISISKVL